MRKAITGDTRQALWKTAGMFRTMALILLWKSRRKDIRVSGAKALFPFMTGNAVNVRRRWSRACQREVQGKSEGGEGKDNGGT